MLILTLSTMCHCSQCLLSIICVILTLLLWFCKFYLLFIHIYTCSSYVWLIWLRIMVVITDSCVSAFFSLYSWTVVSVCLKLALLCDSSHIFYSCGEDAVSYEVDLRQEKPNKSAFANFYYLFLTNSESRTLPCVLSYKCHQHFGIKYVPCFTWKISEHRN